MKSAALFSYSKRRQSLWEHCRFGYFLHYYGAAGGFDPDAPRGVRLIHELKSLLTAHDYLMRLVAEEVRRSFYRPADMPFQRRLFPALRRRFLREFGQMLLGLPADDHKLPMLAELYYGEAPERLKLRLENELREISSALERELLPALEAVGPERRRPIAVPLPVQINELSCYIAPWVVFADGGTLCIIDAAADETTLLLHRYYALNVHRTPPERVRSLQIFPAAGELRLCGNELNISLTVQRLLAGAAEMRNALRPGGDAVPEDFPRNPASCAKCRFRRYCT